MNPAYIRISSHTRTSVNKLNAAILKVLSQPNVRAHFAEGDKEPVGNSPAEFKQFIATDAERLRMQVKVSGARMD